MHSLPVNGSVMNPTKRVEEAWKAKESLHAANCTDVECLKTGHRMGNPYCKYENQPIRKAYMRSGSSLPKVVRNSVDATAKRDRLGTSMGFSSTNVGNMKNIEEDDY